MSGDNSREGRARFLPFLPKFVFEADRVKSRYVARTLALTLLPSLALSSLLGLLLPKAEAPDLETQGHVALLLIVVAAPLIETLIMGAILLVLARFLPAGAAALASAFLWAGAHSLSAPIWGLVVWWPFLVFSAAFLTWRRHSLLAAFGIVTVVHALQNGTGMLLLLATDQLG